MTRSDSRQPSGTRRRTFTRMLRIASIWIVMVVGVVLFIGWVTALVGLPLVRIRTEIEIGASKQVVWATLSDFASYPAWNPNTIEVQGTLKPGNRIDFKARVGESVRELNAEIEQVREFEEISWTGPVSAWCGPCSGASTASLSRRSRRSASGSRIASTSAACSPCPCGPI